MLIRLRADWPVVAAAWVLLLCATTLLTAGTLYGDAVALGGVRDAVAAAPALDRAIVVRSSALIDDAAALDGPIRSRLDAITGPSGGTVDAIVRADPFVPAADGDAGSRLLVIASYEGIERHATLIDGRWPDEAAPAGPSPVTVPVALSRGSAAALAVVVGDRLALRGRLDAGLDLDVEVVGIWEPDAADPYWLGDGLELEGAQTSGGFTTIGPLVAARAALLDPALGARRALEWRGQVDPSGLRLEDLETTQSTADRLAATLGAEVPTSAQVRVETRLPALLASVARSSLVSRTGVLLLVVQFAILAAYAIVLVAGMLADRRRAETALLRSRGASGAHLAGMAVFEAVLLTGTAALVAPFAAQLVVGVLGRTGPLGGAGIAADIGIGADAVIVDVITAAACVVALTLPALGGFPSLAGVRAALSRQAGRTLAQRLGLDIVLVVLAGLALWQLRLYGAPLTRNARGVLGIDPLLVAAPGIGLLAGAVVATRLIPRLAELAERLLVRQRGLVPAMGGRGLARRPLRYTRAALLLMLAAALGTFASAHVATWARSQADQAAYQVGADLRYVPSQRAVPGMAIGTTLRAIPGADGAMAIDETTIDAGREVRGAPLLGIDAAQAAGILIPTPDADGAAISSLLAELAGDRPAPEGIPLPPETRALAVRLTSALRTEFFDPALPPTDPTTTLGIRASVVLLDADGRRYRLTSNDSGVLTGASQRLTIALPTLADPQLGIAAPLALVSIELGFSAPSGTAVIGTADLDGIDVTEGSTAAPDAPGWAPIALSPDTPGWSWTAVSGGAPAAAYSPPPDRPWRLVSDFQVAGALDPVFAGAPLAARLTAGQESRASIAAIVSRGFLAATGSSVGDTVAASFDGARHVLRIVGAVDTFPTLDPATPFVVLDGPTLVAARFGATNGVIAPDAWWIASPDAAAVAAAIAAGPDPAAEVATRSDVEAALATDPVPLGVVGVLGLGSIAALLFAAIGFVVAATVSTRERLGEFALLRALGLSSRQLSLWLSLEHAFLLVVGVTGGVALGVLLAQVVLPVTTLTASGAPAVPAPVVIVPGAALAPIPILAGIVFAITLVVLRGQLLRVRVGDVLRGRDE